MAGIPRRNTLLALLLVLGLVAAACSSDAADESAAASDDTTTTTEAQAAVDDDTTTTTVEAETTTSAAPAQPAPELEAANCEFPEPEGISTDCGWIEVPQHWDDPTDPDTIRLHVATFTSELTPADADPVVYLEGGPGGDTFGLVELTFLDRWGTLVDEHPIVLFSQRGAALTTVDLECEEVVDTSIQILEQQPDIDAELIEINNAFQACADRVIAEGADVSAYNSVASANDADAIREALGYETWNVLGISYGTRLGQELVRQHPDGVRALILDSVQPTDPAFGSLASVAQTFEGAAEQLFAGCAADEACASTYPDLEDRLRAIITQAGVDPFELQAADQLTGEFYDVIVDDTRLAAAVFQSLYSPEAFSALPEMVAELEQGETAILATLMGLNITNAPFISNGMYASVMCHDFLAELTPPEAFEAGLSGDALFDEVFDNSGFEELRGMCVAFDTGSADPSVIEPVESDVPTLIMAGAYDPITPPSFAEVIAPGFSNGQLAILPHAGHGVVGTDCGMAIAIDFFADPSAEADQSCIPSSATPLWVPASLDGVAFEPFSDPLVGVSGVIPEGWLDQGFGVSVRNDGNIAHQSVLIQQVAPVPTTQLLALLGSQFEAEPIEAGSITVAGRDWTIYESDSPLGSIRFWIHEASPLTFLVGAIGPESDVDDMAEHVIPTVLAEIQNG